MDDMVRSNDEWRDMHTSACARIAALESQLAEERRRRDRVVEMLVDECWRVEPPDPGGYGDRREWYEFAGEPPKVREWRSR